MIPFFQMQMQLLSGALLRIGKHITSSLIARAGLGPICSSDTNGISSGPLRSARIVNLLQAESIPKLLTKRSGSSSATSIENCTGRAGQKKNTAVLCGRAARSSIGRVGFTSMLLPLIPKLISIRSCADCRGWIFGLSTTGSLGLSRLTVKVTLRGTSASTPRRAARLT